MNQPEIKSRTASSMRNMAVSVIAQIIKLLLLFATRVVFLHTIGRAYLGVNGLFTNVLTLLSLPELGFGMAIIFYMYKPVSEGNKEKIKSLLKLYKKLYLYIALIILLLGSILIPFINNFVNMPDGADVNLYIVYCMFLANTVIGYLAAYKRAVIEANQDLYITNLVRALFQSLMSGAQILIILVWGNYYVYLLIMIFATIAENISVSVLANKMYPYIKEPAQELDKEEKKNIFRNTSYIFVNKISNAVLIGSSSIIINFFFGVEMVGVFDNYSFVYTAVATFVGFLFTSISASVGNLMVSADKSVLYDRYKKITFIFNMLNAFTSVCLFVLLSPFVYVWAGKENILGISTVVAMVASYYLNNNRNYIRVYKNAGGLFRQGMFIYLIEAILNIGLSIVFAYFFGIIGVLLGIIVSYLVSCFIMEPVIVFKQVFGVNPIYYYVNVILNTGFIVLTSAGIYFLVSLIPDGGVIDFIIKALVCVGCAAAVCILISVISPYRKFVISSFGIIKRAFSRKKGGNNG